MRVFIVVMGAGTQSVLFHMTFAVSAICLSDRNARESSAGGSR